MFLKTQRLSVIPWILLVTLGGAGLQAQTTGALRGSITLKETGDALHGASVLIVELGRSTLSGDDGGYELSRLPPGNYHVIAHLDSVFTEAAKQVTVAAGETATLDFTLALRDEKYSITVTSSGKEETTFESFNSVDSLDAYDLTFSRDVSLGEALDQKIGTGIAKRSFGPGSSRPIIRGFDGDRVLIMEDGIRTGTLSSQSGDHGEVMNTALLERLEIVKGPATLLYSGNAMGGTVNAISRHHEMHRHPHEGLRGFLTGSAGTNNALGGGGGGFEYGVKNWMLWGSAGGTRSSDYSAPQVGEIFNSRSNVANGGGGFGWFGAKTYFSFDFRADDGRYGVPFASEFHGHGHDDEDEHDEDEDDHGDEDEHEDEIERIALDTQRRSYRLSWGLNDLGPVIDRFSLKVSYTDWAHDEIEHFEDGDTAIGTSFRNDQLIYRGELEQVKRGRLSGRFGFWGIDRSYEVSGEEALSPNTDQDGLALFALEELGFERFKLQFGGRVETQLYRPRSAARGLGHGHEDEDDHDEDEDEHDDDGHGEEIPDAVRRRFTGGSAAVGVHADLGRAAPLSPTIAQLPRPGAGGALQPRAPRRQPAFEIGNPGMNAETATASTCRCATRKDASARCKLLHYDFSNFIFPFLTGRKRMVCA